MAIVMDRSGSMGMSAGAGLTKMDLANTGAAVRWSCSAIRCRVGAAVDTPGASVVELAKWGPIEYRIGEAVRRIDSGGGGIFYNDSSRMGRTPRKRRPAPAPDPVCDATTPGIRRLYRARREDAAEARNRERDWAGHGGGSLHAVLRDIAERAAGGYFSTPTRTSCRDFRTGDRVGCPSAVHQRPNAGAGDSRLGGNRGAASRVLARSMLHLSYLRPGAGLRSSRTDEYQGPLVARGARAGRVRRLSFPLGGPHSEKIRAWPGYGDFVQTLARWLGGEDAPADWRCARDRGRAA